MAKPPRGYNNWCKPDQGVSKLNCDASILFAGDSCWASMFVVARDSEGVTVDFAVRRRRMNSVLAAEVEAIRLAMQLAIERG